MLVEVGRQRMQTKLKVGNMVDLTSVQLSMSGVVVFAVLQVGRKAQMGPSFSVQLLEEADELGMQVRSGP